MQRIVEAGVAGVPALAVLQHEEVPANFAAVGSGEREDGTHVVVAFAPRSAGDALLAGLLTGARLAEEPGGFSGEVVVVAPHWSSAARRRLALVNETPFRLRGAEVAALGDGNPGIQPDTQPTRLVLTVAAVAARLASGADRALFLRAAAALEGLASKHGGAVRGCGASVELVILARRVAELRAADGRLELNTILPQRSTTTLNSDDLAEALDRLEGHLRKRLGDRRTRDGEEGLRSRAIPLLAQAKELRAVTAWPLGGADEEAIDLVGVDASGEVVIGAIREEFGLSALGAVVDASLSLQPMLPSVLAGVEAPVRIGVPRLALAASRFAPGTLRALGTLGLAFDAFEVRAPRGRGVEVAPLGSGAASRAARDDTPRDVRREPFRDSQRGEPRNSDREAIGNPLRGGPAEERPDASRDGQRGQRDNGEGRGRRRRSRRGRSDRFEGSPRGEESRDLDAAASEGLLDVESDSDSDPEFDADRDRDSNGDSPRSRRRRSGGRGRGGRGGSAERPRADEGDGTSENEVRDGAERPPAPRFDEFSSFDLEDEPTPSEGEGGRPRRRGRSRRRGRRGAGGAREEGSASESDPERPEFEAGANAADESLVADDDDDQLSGLAELPDEVEIGVVEPTYDEEEDLGEDADSAEHAARLERERRRLARLAKEEPEPPRPPRRRAVIVAHADRDSLIAAIVLARDVRLLEGIWVYPQADLMTFFRSVATDLREDTPIYLVGFTPSPSRDVLQAAGLYRERLVWFDHHDWPPEDLDAIQHLIGDEQMHLRAGAGSTLPLVLATCTRRSRFTDKLVDLATGRFTLHDFERWGRLWWSRLGKIAKKGGEVRSDIDPLLAGRPSDLAREASRVPAPDLPPELEYVSRRDFRLVHFGGYSLVIVDLEPELDVHLAARIARERHGATLSLSYRRGDDAMVLAGDELAGNRSLDFSAVVEHLGSKHSWIEAQSDDDHVARFRIRDLAAHPDRLEDVIGTIAMGRSILER